MNKSDLILAAAEAADISKAAAGKALNGILAAITSALTEGERVTLVGFGTFSTVKRAKRKVRNPSTGKKMKIKAKTVAKFKVGKNLAEAVK